MALDPFEREVLGWVCDDYEAVDTIREDIARDLGRSVSAAEVTSALLALAHAGFVDAYVYDSSSSTYRRVGVNESSVEDLWFLTNSEGLAEYERSGA